MFEEKLHNQLHLQSQLKLNGLCNSEEKKLILSFMKSPEILSEMLEVLKKDEITMRFAELSNHDDPEEAFERIVTEMFGSLEKKALNDN